MLEVCSMPSHGAEALRCESYTTPRSVSSDTSLGKHASKDAEEETDGHATSTVKNRDGVRSAPSHFSPQISQSLTEILVDNSEQCSLDDALVFESSVLDDWSEAASGWRVVVPYPKYVVQQPPTRRKLESGIKKGGVSARTAVRCVDEDFSGEQWCPPWKGNVEPVTYRYVPNNGYYRNNKSARDIREWLTLKRGRSEKAMVTPEIRQAQKTLKRDLENHFKTPSDENTAAAHSAASVLSQEPTVKFQQTVSQQQQIQAEQRDRHPHVMHITKRLPAKEQQLMKSASDLFMEKFNTRLNALQKEIHNPHGPVVTKKSAEPSSVPNHSPTQMTKKLREVRITDTMKPTIQSTKQHGANFGEDLFTIIPMCKPEIPLRPLEKLTPKQKQMEKSASRERSPSPELQSQEDEEEEEEEELMIMLAAASSQPPPLPKDTDSSGISTARSAIAMTNFDIEKMRNIPLRTEFGNKPKPFYVQKGSGPTFRKGAMRYTVAGNNGQTPDQAALVDEAVDAGDFSSHIERHMDKEMDSVGAALPEIMGKRLSVITTSHRLL